MYIGTIIRLLLVLVMVAGFSACDQIQQLLLPGAPETETPTPIEERDHVWVVDQNGVEVPIPGTWVLVSRTNLNSTYVIGESFTFARHTGSGTSRVRHGCTTSRGMARLTDLLGTIVSRQPDELRLSGA